MPLLPAATHPASPIWDLFCRVVDNHGDIGVCWRLAADLASRGLVVRLWIDDAHALSWMAPTGASGVEVRPWPATGGDMARAIAQPADVVIEAFGCGLPEPYLRHLAETHRRSAAPIWINLEYLSAESYAERSHGLPSLQGSGTARGLTTWFFYPGFTPQAGGLLRETDLAQQQAVFDRDAWLRDHGIAPLPGERLVSVFCYANPTLPGLLRALAVRPTLLLTTPGHATEQVTQALAGTNDLKLLRTHALPWLSQTDYDHLLWACDLNFVRGEDSLVRAIWAARPFVWQIYPQHDDAHAAKLAAFFSKKLGPMDPSMSAAIGDAGWRWNGLDRRLRLPETAEPEVWHLLNSPAAVSAWGARCASWRTELLAQPDLTTQLLAFVAARQTGAQAKI